MTTDQLQGISSGTKILLIVATILLPVSLLIHLGLTPLMLEEPRRALVAMELAFSGNPWVPTLYGELYYNKPPVFNWILWLGVQLTGAFEEWALRLPTVGSLLGIGGITFWIGRRYVGPSFGWISALLTVCSVDILFYFSMLAEIDLFYSLLSFGAIISVFHFYQSGRPYVLFLLVYALTAAGFLTKGLPSIVFTGLTLVVYLGYKRAWKWLFSPAHLTGILLFCALSGAYFFQYAQYEDPLPFLTNMWDASSKRSVIGSQWLKLPAHLLTFPLDTLKNVLPATLLLAFGLNKRGWRQLWEHELMRFAVLAFVANFLVYWISPGSRQRYIYMLYPLLIFPFTYLYWQHRDFTAGRRFLQILSLLLCAILSVGSIALLFIPASENGPTPISAWVAIPFFLISAGLFTYQWRRSSLALPAIIVLLVLARILFDLVVLPQRARQSNAVREREWALQVDALAGGRPVHLVQGHRAPFTFSFYLARIREKPLEMIDNYQPDSYYLLQDQAPDNWQTLSRYEDNGQTFFFGRFTEPPSPRIFQERAQGAGIFREY